MTGQIFMENNIATSQDIKNISYNPVISFLDININPKNQTC